MTGVTPLRQFYLRGAGFPVTDAMLPSTGSARSARRLLAQEEGLSRLAEEIRMELAGVPPERVLRAERRRIAKRLRQRAPLPEPLPGPLTEDPLGALAQEWNAACGRRDRTRAEVTERATAEMAAAVAHLRRWCARPEVAEALWSSRPGAADSLARFAQGRTSQAWVRRLGLRFLQRFAMKNETASFFGPFQFGQVADGGAEGTGVLRFDPGSPRLGPRFTALARFVVDGLADQIGADLCQEPGIRLVPHPLAVCERDTLRIGDRGVRLPPALGAAIRAGGLTPAGLPAAERAAARKLVAANLLLPDLHPASTSLDALGDLRERVGALPGERAGRWDRLLGELQRAVTALPQTPWPRYRQEVERLSEHVARRGVNVTDRPSGLYADSSVVVTECRGGLRGLAVDRGALSRHLPALAAVLRVHAAHAAAVRRAVREWLREQWARSGLGDEVSLAELAVVADPEQAPMDGGGYAQAVWSRLDRIAPEGRTRVQVTASAVESAFGDLLPAEHFLCSPDLLVWPRPGGEDRLVLGEVHHAVQVWGFLQATQPAAARAEVRAQLEEWAAKLAGPHRLATMVEPRRTGKTFTLELPGLAIERMGRSALDRRQVRSLHQVRVDRATLQLRDADGPLVLAPFSPVDPIVRAMGGLVLWGPRSPALRTHRPRLVVDDVVWFRESWRLTGGQLAEVRAARTPAEIALATAKLRDDFGMPRWVFVRVPAEPKPVCVDLESVAYGDLLARMLAMTPTGDPDQPLADITEMLPGPDEVRLHCAGGRFTSELRMSMMVGPR